MTDEHPLDYGDFSWLRSLKEALLRLRPLRQLRFMHVCGTHENAIARFGLRSLLPPWLQVIAGPGCPVCVCPPADIDMAVRLMLEQDVLVCTFGDMLAVPGRISLAQARAQGGKLKVVVSAAQALQLAESNPNRQVVFLAVGFETTACTTAALLSGQVPNNFTVLLAHRLIPPAMRALLSFDDLAIDGFLLPGHVLTVAGTRDYQTLAEHSGKPMVVAGFEARDILLAILCLSRLAMEDQNRLVNCYGRAVRAQGNTKAIRAMERLFEPVQASWRGLGVFPQSGFAFKPEFLKFDAAKRFGIAPDVHLPDSQPGCSCGQVMAGLSQPEDCSLFGSMCEPSSPQGPCMVSSEGTCHNRYIYCDYEETGFSNASLPPC